MHEDENQVVIKARLFEEDPEHGNRTSDYVSG